MKSLLIMATGNKLKALAAQKGVNVITNVTSKYLQLNKSMHMCVCALCVYLPFQRLQNLQNKEKLQTDIEFNPSQKKGREENLI